jgi:hypothetical protein
MPGLLRCMKAGFFHKARFIPECFKQNLGGDVVTRCERLPALCSALRPGVDFGILKVRWAIHKKFWDKIPGVHLHAIALQWYQCDLVTIFLLLLYHRKFFRVGCKNFCRKDSPEFCALECFARGCDVTDVFVGSRPFINSAPFLHKRQYLLFYYRRQ